VEWTNYARLTDWLRLDADASFSRARFVGAAADADHVPGAVGRVISAGFTVESEQPVFGTLRLRHFGPRALVEDDSVRSESTNVFNGEVGYRVAAGVNLVLELYNLFDAEVSDIDYFYASRLPGEPVGGVEDIHTHPALPRTGRVSLQVRF
jgi:outer membrane receptor protein involved in Fe transport